MDRLADSNRILVALRRASALGIELVDTADVYTWGLTREFAAVRAVCSAGIASAVSGRVNDRPAAPAWSHLRKVAGNER